MKTTIGVDLHKERMTCVVLDEQGSALAGQIRHQACHLGGSLNATIRHLLERSLKPLHLRVERQTHSPVGWRMPSTMAQAAISQKTSARSPVSSRTRLAIAERRRSGRCPQSR